MQQVLLSFLVVTIPALAIPVSARCFLQPSLGGVPNENSSPLLCTLMSSRESADEVSEDDDKLMDSDALEPINNELTSEENSMDDDQKDALLRSLRQEPGHKFLRFGRASSNHNFLRFGRDPEHKFLRFGRDQHKFLRFGRSVANGEENRLRLRENQSKMTVLPMFMRLGRGPEHVFMRFGRQGSNSEGHKFMRFGRTQNDTPVQDENTQQEKA
uniref:FMRFamide n=1 Tax=Strigamia maritima TaxID=126957 RepID=T1JBI0_STRMM